MRRPFAVVVALLTLVLAGCSSGGYPVPGQTAQSPPPTTFQPQHAGGTLTILSKSAAGTVDPHISYDNQPWQLLHTVYDGLLAFRQVGGEKSTELVPDIAQAMPKVTDSGRTYTFTIRRGVRFSTGAQVTPTDVVASFRRIFRASGPTAGTFYQNIVGADACLAEPATCTLPGVTARGRDIVIRLTRADSEFAMKLAVPHAVILPADTPAKDQGNRPIPGTGPYVISSYDPNRQLLMERNPRFKEWSHAAQPQGYPDRIVYKYGTTVEGAVTAVENGSADVVWDPPPADRLNELGTRFVNQVHVNSLNAFWYLPLNVNIAPFNNLKARQAVNWAIDRSATTRLFGGNALGRPACTVLPDGFPGHTDFCDYTEPAGTVWKGNDLTKAKRLVKESGTAGQKVAVVVADDDTSKAMGEYVRSVLQQIGYRATLKVLSANIQFSYIQNTKNNVQISVTQWYQDYPAASDFLNVLLSCASFHKASDSSINIGGYCDRKLDATMRRAMQLDQSDPEAAARLWGQADRQAMSQAPLVPLFAPRQVDFLSRRVGNYQFHQQFFMLIDQLWVK
ncbi:MULTISPECIES: ABC transporter substrate-binding protein [unclassified Streptomyces]|uniref:ABC transporter substrate-binding protein n=1 Tax=unclassified Streptomyces TaxID=2593676 RepID=UPI002257AE40|nr:MULTISPECIES: ABC transporter substrate-binding protein [unclassified Streptomyces]MCX5280391.1 ABC transporter substrate-binding protein [Streptomyces sp. NBC_00198]WSD76397.1 ABC transporter substrate-binding protein [Streptomyces sp. NBC_01558]